jgi:hypothetical protein
MTVGRSPSAVGRKLAWRRFERVLPRVSRWVLRQASPCGAGPTADGERPAP